MTARRVSEAEKQRQVPGLIFVDGPAGRRARIDGSGLDVWEVISAYKRMGCDRTRLEAAFDWMTAEQMDAALRYYALFPDEIDRRLALEASMTPEKIRRLLKRAAEDR
jgi:uncharacterized protein (DUF433 family)